MPRTTVPHPDYALPPDLGFGLRETCLSLNVCRALCPAWVQRFVRQLLRLLIPRRRCCVAEVDRVQQLSFHGAVHESEEQDISRGSALPCAEGLGFDVTCGGSGIAWSPRVTRVVSSHSNKRCRASLGQLIRVFSRDYGSAVHPCEGTTSVTNYPLCVPCSVSLLQATCSSRSKKSTFLSET